MVSLIDIHDLNPKNQALNRRHQPRTKPVPIQDTTHQIGQTWSPTRPEMEFDTHKPKTLLNNTRVTKTVFNYIHEKSIQTPMRLPKLGKLKAVKLSKFDTLRNPAIQI